MQSVRLPERPEELLPSVRAALCRELLEKHGLRKVQVASILGVRPATVTHYLSKKRGAQWLEAIESDATARRMISEAAESMARRHRLGVAVEASREVSELANRLYSVIAGERAAGGAGVLSEETLSSIAERIRLEEAVARRVLEVMNRVRDAAVQQVLRQIAVDSLRHAEILTLVSRGIGTDHGSLRSDLALLEELMEYESEAEEKGLTELAEMVGNPALAALLVSIDHDEQKHVAMLEVLLGSRRSVA
ncbi:MAG: hypothetical protein RMJ30_01595 [Nitrososphaerota archaeon]|nr:hypothetical protein [Nitrososphaerota archaeon]